MKDSNVWGPWADGKTRKLQRDNAKGCKAIAKAKSDHDVGPWVCADNDSAAASSDVGPWCGELGSGCLDVADTAEGALGPWHNVDPPTKKLKGCVDVSAAIVVGVPDQMQSDPEREPTKRELNGKNKSVIKGRLEGKGRCKCTGEKKDCHRHVELSVLFPISVLLWSLGALERACLLHTLHENAAGKDSDSEHVRRVHWYIGTQRVCFTNFCFLLQMSPGHIRECISGTTLAKIKHKPRKKKAVHPVPAC